MNPSILQFSITPVRPVDSSLHRPHARLILTFATHTTRTPLRRSTHSPRAFIHSHIHSCCHNTRAGVNHMFTLSALQLHPRACIVCDDDATGELRVRTVRYFKGLERVHQESLEPLEEGGNQVLSGESVAALEDEEKRAEE